VSAPEWYKPQPHSPHVVYAKEVIRDIQRTLLVPETGVFDDATVTHIKGLQYALNVTATGRIDERTAEGIQSLRDRYQEDASE
jgi:hypothetical protein